MFEYSEKYKFTENWFSSAIPVWEELFELYGRDKVKNVLEIGCYEGRATIFICENILQNKGNYDVVDTFRGTLEETGMKNTAERLETDNFIENNFKHNISFHPEINFSINKGYSQYILPTLVEQGKQYDFIYIDASHKTDDTFVDAYYAHKMLKPGGMIVFDDFLWKDPNDPHPVSSPELGIKMFFSVYDNLYTLAMQGYQIGAIKN